MKLEAPVVELSLVLAIAHLDQRKDLPVLEELIFYGYDLPLKVEFLECPPRWVIRILATSLAELKQSIEAFNQRYAFSIGKINGQLYGLLEWAMSHGVQTLRFDETGRIYPELINPEIATTPDSAPLLLTLDQRYRALLAAALERSADNPWLLQVLSNHYPDTAPMTRTEVKALAQELAVNPELTAITREVL
ncbi:MAG: hypothetical protein AAGF24_00090 [Cyanobacteria bacterium P01_H01_bin.121]